MYHPPVICQSFFVYDSNIFFLFAMESQKSRHLCEKFLASCNRYPKTFSHLLFFFWCQVWPEPRGGGAAQPGQHHRPTELTAGAAVRRALRQPASLRLLVLPAAAWLELSWLPHQARQRTIAPLAADIWNFFAYLSTKATTSGSQRPIVPLAAHIWTFFAYLSTEAATPGTPENNWATSGRYMNFFGIPKKRDYLHTRHAREQLRL